MAVRGLAVVLTLVLADVMCRRFESPLRTRLSSPRFQPSPTVSGSVTESA